jgi:hypothetical protein
MMMATSKDFTALPFDLQARRDQKGDAKSFCL